MQACGGGRYDCRTAFPGHHAPSPFRELLLEGESSNRNVPNWEFLSAPEHRPRLDDEDFWDQPHEGNMLEFLYKRRSIERGW
jgi:hypothetical protein